MTSDDETGYGPPPPLWLVRASHRWVDLADFIVDNYTIVDADRLDAYSRYAHRWGWDDLWDAFDCASRRRVQP